MTFHGLSQLSAIAMSSRTTSQRLGRTAHLRAAAGSSNAAAADLGTAALIRTRREKNRSSQPGLVCLNADGFFDNRMEMEIWEEWDDDSTTGLHLV